MQKLQHEETADPSLPSRCPQWPELESQELLWQWPTLLGERWVWWRSLHTVTTRPDQTCSKPTSRLRKFNIRWRKTLENNCVTQTQDTLTYGIFLLLLGGNYQTLLHRWCVSLLQPAAKENHQPSVPLDLRLCWWLSPRQRHLEETLLSSYISQRLLV